MLTIAAGAAGLALSWKLTEFMTAVRVTIARGTPATIDVSLDGTVLATSLLVVAGAGVLFSLLPALETSRPDLVGALKDAPGSSGRARGTSRRILVAVQIAISMVLLAAGGLFLRSLQNARTLSPSEAAQRGYRQGAVVEEEPGGEERLVQPSDVKSPEAVAQEFEVASGMPQVPTR